MQTERVLVDNDWAVYSTSNQGVCLIEPIDNAIITYAWRTANSDILGENDVYHLLDGAQTANRGSEVGWLYMRALGGNPFVAITQ